MTYFLLIIKLDLGDMQHRIKAMSAAKGQENVPNVNLNIWR